MLEIKTITQKADSPEEFDKKVNSALADGWELVRRDVLPETPQWHRYFYAELEKRTEDGTAEWLIHRTSDGYTQCRCSACGTVIVTRMNILPSMCVTCKRSRTQREVMP